MVAVPDRRPRGRCPRGHRLRGDRPRAVEQADGARVAAGPPSPKSVHPVLLALSVPPNPIGCGLPSKLPQAAARRPVEKTVVIHDPSSPDGGTAFRPTDGKAYFNRLQ
jgi:hypothetical protein